MSNTEDGEIIYRFPSDVRAALRRRSRRYRVRSLAERAWPKVYYGIRVGFGVALLTSIVAIFATLAVIQAGAEAVGEEEDRRSGSYGRGARRGGGDVHFNFFGPSLWGPSPFDFLYYRPRYGYYGRRRLPRRSPSSLMRERPSSSRGVYDDDGTAHAADGDELSYLESVFSYVFGDGDPNACLDESRLRSAVSFVRDDGEPRRPSSSRCS